MKRFNITVNGHAYDVMVEEVNAAAAPAVPVAVPAPAVVPAPAAAPAVPEAQPAASSSDVTSSAAEGAETIDAPMPGTIVSILVNVGDKVEKGQALLLLEAMKMENEIMAPHDAVVAGIHVSKGDSVNSGTLLVSLK